MLQLLGNPPLIPRKELSREPTLPTQRRRPNLQARLMPQIIRLHLPFQMIPRMHHLMRHSILLMPPISKLIRAQQDPMVEAEPAGLLVRAHATQDVGGIEVAAEFVDFVR